MTNNVAAPSQLWRGPRNQWFPTAGGTRADNHSWLDVPQLPPDRGKVAFMGTGVMKKAVWSGIATAAVFLVGTSAFAQTTVPATVNVTANVNAKAKLTLGAATLLFDDADPDTDPTIAAPALSVSVKARTTAGAGVTLTVLAGNDLVSGTDVIPISNLSWAATGTGFSAGTSNKTTAQAVGGWSGSGNQAGSQTYSLLNSWAYATGIYTATLTYTLTVP